MKKCEQCQGNSNCIFLKENYNYVCCFCFETDTYGSKFWKNGYWKETAFGTWCNECKMKIEDSYNKQTKISEFR